ncbi:MAG: hypothetical protein WC554_17600 [Clostridia bacterium]
MKYKVSIERFFNHHCIYVGIDYWRLQKSSQFAIMFLFWEIIFEKSCKNRLSKYGKSKHLIIGFLEFDFYYKPQRYGLEFCYFWGSDKGIEITIGPFEIEISLGYK